MTDRIEIRSTPEAERQRTMRAATLKRYRDKHSPPREDNLPRLNLMGLTAKQVVFYHYGRVCACCLSTENLQIDHVEPRKPEDKRGGETLYRWLIRNNFPEGYQVLCGFCDNSKHDGEV